MNNLEIQGTASRLCAGTLLIGLLGIGGVDIADGKEGAPRFASDQAPESVGRVINGAAAPTAGI